MRLPVIATIDVDDAPASLVLALVAAANREGWDVFRISYGDPGDGPGSDRHEVRLTVGRCPDGSP